MAKQVYALDAELKEAVQNVVRQMLNSFQPRPKRGRRPRASGVSSSLIEVALTETVPAATWDVEDAERTRPTIEAPVFSGDTFDINNKVSFSNGLGTSASVSPDKFRVGYVLGGRLIVVDCNEFDMPDE